MKRIAAALLGVTLFAAIDAVAAPAESNVQIFPLGQIRAGMKGVAYSVFDGTEPESFPVEVVGVLRNAWGPKQDIILVRVGGKFAQTGVAAGMSGSPIYFDGKWAGAISLRIGTFPTDPIAGVTPAELMMDIRATDKTQPAITIPSAEPPVENKASTQTGKQVLAALAPILPPLPAASSLKNGYLTPIETPLVFSGFSSSALSFLSPVFQRMGVVAVQGGAEAVSADIPPETDLKTALPPGSAVSAMLATGDLSLAATGTVTYNDGTHVLAFGHPFFGLGP